MVKKTCNDCVHFKPLVENDVYGRCYYLFVAVVDDDDDEIVAAPRLVYSSQKSCKDFNAPYSHQQALENMEIQIQTITNIKIR